MQESATFPLGLFVSLACASCASDATRSIAAEQSPTATARPTATRPASRPTSSHTPSSRTTNVDPRTGREYETKLVEGEPMYALLSRDRIRSIDAPQFIAASEADAVMLDDDPVLGVVGADGPAKCYSAWQLDRHEIVSDSIDGHSIAVTW